MKILTIHRTGKIDVAVYLFSSLAVIGMYICMWNALSYLLTSFDFQFKPISLFDIKWQTLMPSIGLYLGLTSCLYGNMRKHGACCYIIENMNEI